VAGNPIMAAASVGPMARCPSPTRMWGFRPSSANKYIGATSWFPLFIYPYVAGTGSGCPYIMWYWGPNVNKYLRMAAVCATCKRYSQNKQHSFDTLHSMYFLV